MAAGWMVLFFAMVGVKPLQYRDVYRVEYRDGTRSTAYVDGSDTADDDDDGNEMVGTLSGCIKSESIEGAIVDTEACSTVVSISRETWPLVPLQFPIGTLIWTLVAGLPLLFGIR